MGEDVSPLTPPPYSARRLTPLTLHSPHTPTRPTLLRSTSFHLFMTGSRPLCQVTTLEIY